MEISELALDDFIYPRKKKSQTTINAYAEALSIGAQFPPVEVQRVRNYPQNGKLVDAILILDGYHRWEAAKKQKLEEIEVIEWKPDEALDYDACKIELRLETSERNTRHGNRLSEGDKKATAELIAENDSEEKWTEQAIADKLGISRETISDWISPIRTRQRATRESKIYKLERLGWTQQEIADRMAELGFKELTQQRVQQITSNGNLTKICNLLDEGRTMEEICDFLRIDMALAWAVKLEGKDDKYRFDGDAESKEDPGELGWRVRVYDYWNFGECDSRFGDAWAGRIPAQLVAHTLFFFTREGDLVMDPMAGGGVVPDTCLLFGRKCRAFDVNIRPERPEIEYHYWNYEDLEWPSCLLKGYEKKPRLIFFDPPYYTKKKKEYEKGIEEGIIPISSLPRNDYLQFFNDFFVLAHQHSLEDARIAFLNADWRNFASTPALEEESEGAVSIFDYKDILEETGWRVTHRIECPLSTQRFKGNMVTAMQNNRTIGTIGRTLLIARKDK